MCKRTTLFKLIFSVLIILHYGCTSIPIKTEKDFSKICEERIKPVYNKGKLIVFNKDAKSDVEVKKCLSSFDESKNYYDSYETNKKISNVILSGSGISIGSSLIMFIAVTIRSIFGLYTPESFQIACLISGVSGLFMIPFAGWQATESENNLLKSIYYYNHSCFCKQNEANKKELNNCFYYPQKNILGGLDFVNLCTQERFSYNSDLVKSYFNNVSDLQKYIENITIDLKTMEHIVLGAVSLSLLGFFSNNFIPFVFGISVTIPLLVFPFISYEDAFNNAFSLLDEVNNWCCK